MTYISDLLDFSIYYESEKRSFWDFLCGKMSNVKIIVQKINIPESFLNRNYSEDQEFRKDLKNWLYNIWKDKDKFLS